MTKYYERQMRDVLAGIAETSSAPPVAIHPAWKTNGVYHDLFFDPTFNDMHQTFWDDLLEFHKLQRAGWEEEAANCVSPVVL